LFELDTQSPASAVPISPSEGETVYDTHPSFAWSTVARSSGSPEFYGLELSSDSLFGGAGEYRHYDDISDTAYTLTEPLTIDGTYFWRVNHYDIAGNESGYSGIATFILASYICGDADGSAAVDIDDVVYLINYIFAGAPPPDPLESGDANCSGEVDIDDVVFLINYIFASGYVPCDTDGNGESDC